MKCMCMKCEWRRRDNQEPEPCTKQTKVFENEEVVLLVKKKDRDEQGLFAVQYRTALYGPFVGVAAAVAWARRTNRVSRTNYAIVPLTTPSA
jgi:hypothetical protein